VSAALSSAGVDESVRKSSASASALSPLVGNPGHPSAYNLAQGLIAQHCYTTLDLNLPLAKLLVGAKRIRALVLNTHQHSLVHARCIGQYFTNCNTPRTSKATPKPKVLLWGCTHICSASVAAWSRIGATHGATNSAACTAQVRTPEGFSFATPCNTNFTNFNSTQQVHACIGAAAPAALTKSKRQKATKLAAVA